MNLMDLLMNAGNGGAVQEIAKNFGLDSGQAQSALSQVMPALSKGLDRNVKQSGGLDALLGALKSGHHNKYIEDPASLTRDDAINDGNGILGHLLGSKDVSRNVAAQTAEKTGIDASIIKKMLPMVAASLMGSLSQQASGKGLLNQTAQGSSGLGGLLGGLLDADDDGSVVDDVLSIAKKLF